MADKVSDDWSWQERAADGASKGSIGGPYGAIFGGIDGALNGPLYRTTNPNKKKGAGGDNSMMVPDLFANMEGYQAVDVWGESAKAVDFNATEGLSKGKKIAKESNKQAVLDLESAMSAAFGGKAAFENQRTLTNQLIDDHMRGMVSSSTRSEVARNLLASGVTSIGAGPTAEAMTGYLGLTKEGLQQQGSNEYRSLYSMYRQATPLTTTVEAMQYTALDPEAIVAALQRESENAFNSEMAITSAQYTTQYNNVMTQVAMRRDELAAQQAKSNSNGQMMGAIASVAGSYFGGSGGGGGGFGGGSSGGASAGGGGGGASAGGGM